MNYKNSLFTNAIFHALRCAILALLALTTPLVVKAAGQTPFFFDYETKHSHLGRNDPSQLIEKVRRATERFRDINLAMAEGWTPATPCVSGPDAGAMGVHFAHPHPDRIGDGKLDADAPEFLIYEPLSGGAMRLVGVEFVVLAEDWHRRNASKVPPALEGNLLNFVGEPNRYGLPAFYELHVWAWENNPNGTYADWNTQVTCERQTGN